MYDFGKKTKNWYLIFSYFAILLIL